MITTASLLQDAVSALQKLSATQESMLLQLLYLKEITSTHETTTDTLARQDAITLSGFNLSASFSRRPASISCPGRKGLLMGKAWRSSLCCSLLKTSGNCQLLFFLFPSVLHDLPTQYYTAGPLHLQ